MVTTESTSHRELAKLMANHILSYINRDKLIAVMYSDSVTYKIRRDHRSTRPSLDYRLLTRLIHGKNLLLELNANKRAFF